MLIMATEERVCPHKLNGSDLNIYGPQLRAPHSFVEVSKLVSISVDVNDGVVQ